MGGNSGWPLYTTPTHTYQLVDNVSLHPWRHNIRFGGEFRYGGTEHLSAPRRGRGRIVFDDTTDPDDGNVVTPALVNFLQGNFGDEGYAADPYRRYQSQRDDERLWRIPARTTGAYCRGSH